MHAARDFGSDTLAALQFFLARRGDFVDRTKIVREDLRRLGSDEPDAESGKHARQPT